MRLFEINNNSKPEIYVDMDGVLVDFFGAWAKLMGVKDFRGIKDVAAGLQAIRDADNFWLDLDPTPNAGKLLALIQKHKGSYTILSSPLADDPRSEPHKRMWVKNNLKQFPPKAVIITGNKAKYAQQSDGTPNILIDDFGQNIDKWNAAGGIGVKHKDHKFERSFKTILLHLDNNRVKENFAGGSLTAQQMLDKLSKEMQGTHTGASDPNSDWSKYVLSHKGFKLKDIQVDKIPTAVKSDGMSQANIEKYKKADTTKFPPVVIGDNGYPLDGNHRLQAYKYQGIKTIKAYIGESTVVTEEFDNISDIDLNNALDTIAKNAVNGERLKDVFIMRHQHNMTFKQIGNEIDTGIDRARQVYQRALRKLRFLLKDYMSENFADGKKPGRKGLAKRSGVNTKASVSDLRKTAKSSSGEKQRMAHWMANMKAGKAKKK